VDEIIDRLHRNAVKRTEYVILCDPRTKFHKSKRDADMYFLRKYSGFTYDEIADVYRVTRENVRQRLARCVRRLRTYVNLQRRYRKFPTLSTSQFRISDSVFLCLYQTACMRNVIPFDDEQLSDEDRAKFEEHYL